MFRPARLVLSLELPSLEESTGDQAYGRGKQGRRASGFKSDFDLTARPFDWRDRQSGLRELKSASNMELGRCQFCATEAKVKADNTVGR